MEELEEPDCFAKAVESSTDIPRDHRRINVDRTTQNQSQEREAFTHSRRANTHAPPQEQEAFTNCRRAQTHAPQEQVQTHAHTSPQPINDRSFGSILTCQTLCDAILFGIVVTGIVFLGFAFNNAICDGVQYLNIFMIAFATYIVLLIIVFILAALSGALSARFATPTHMRNNTAIPLHWHQRRPVSPDEYLEQYIRCEEALENFDEPAEAETRPQRPWLPIIRNTPVDQLSELCRSCHNCPPTQETSPPERVYTDIPVCRPTSSQNEGDCSRRDGVCKRRPVCPEESHQDSCDEDWFSWQLERRSQPFTSTFAADHAERLRRSAPRPCSASANKTSDSGNPCTLSVPQSMCSSRNCQDCRSTCTQQRQQCGQRVCEPNSNIRNQENNSRCLPQCSPCQSRPETLSFFRIDGYD